MTTRNRRVKALSLTLVGTAGALALTGLAPATAMAAGSTTPDFGPNVKVFDPSTPVDQIDAYLQSIAAEDQFSTDRHLVLFKPCTTGSPAGAENPGSATGTVTAPVGYYTSIAGLGSSPEDVVINGAL